MRKSLNCPLVHMFSTGRLLDLEKEDSVMLLTDKALLYLPSDLVVVLALDGVVAQVHALVVRV